MDGSVGISVEMGSTTQAADAVLRLQLLGPLTISRGGAPVALPKSRKVRALAAYLALAARGVTRSKLCELLWDAPSDPRGELRWCLSRVRSVIDEPDVSRIETRGDAISFDARGCVVDVLEIDRVLKEGVEKLELAELRRLVPLFAGEFLEGLHIENSPLFNQWAAAERRRMRSAHAFVLTEIASRLPEEDHELLTYLEQWLKVDPFERNAHARLLTALVRQGRVREAEEHLAETIRLFEQEGLEWISIREAWRAARNRERPSPSTVRIEPAPEAPATAPPALVLAKRASICVMPFLEETEQGAARSSMGDGLADDIITRLAKLRVLFVIARGTAFALGDRGIDGEEAARILNVDYVASGAIRRRQGRLTIRVELGSTRPARVVWAEQFDCPQDDALRGVEDLGNAIVAHISEEVETAERNRAVLKPPSSLDAWESYHRGLWHIYRFNSADNDRAEHYFRVSAQLDPTFARAHAALSFAHFQNAFLHRPAERETQIDKAFDAAGQSLMADDRDPAAHWAMGRALWLRGRESESLAELTTSVDLSPNFALGHYTVGFVHSQSGDPKLAIGSVDLSRRLSPFDPLMFAMFTTRALAHLRLGEYEEAATWALKATGRPNAHAHALAIAAYCLSAAGRKDEARPLAAKIRAMLPDYGVDDFLAGFRFAPDAQALFRQNARVIGLE